MKRFRNLFSRLIFTLVFLISINTISYSKIVYEDMQSISSWAKEDVISASEKGYIEGSNGKFNPRRFLKNDEYIKMVLEFLEIDLDLSNENLYSKYYTENWAFDYLVTASNIGLIEEPSKFKPRETIIREDMAHILRKALEYKKIDLKRKRNIFKDHSEISKDRIESVEIVNSLGLIRGDNNYYRPKNNVTREMAVVVLMRGKKLVNNTNFESIVDFKKDLNLRPYIEETGKLMYSEITEPSFGTGGGEWTVMGLARGNIKVPDGYYEDYYKRVEDYVKSKKNNLHRVKYTEHSRLILALSAINKDVTNVAGYNQLEKLADFDTLNKQGINGPIFALIALDSKNYGIPMVKDVKVQTTKNQLIDFILDREIDGTGGWALGHNPETLKADPDITGMAIQSLAPYYNKRKDVKEAVDRAIDWLSNEQREDGGYFSWGSVNSESCVQVIVALTSIGIDPHKDERFIKNGRSVVDALMDHYVKGGGFYHIKPGEDSYGGGALPGVRDGMATDQGMYGMIAYDRFINGQNRLYDMTDVN